MINQTLLGQLAPFGSRWIMMGKPAIWVIPELEILLHTTLLLKIEEQYKINQQKVLYSFFFSKVCF